MTTRRLSTCFHFLSWALVILSGLSTQIASAQNQVNIPCPPDAITQPAGTIMMAASNASEQQFELVPGPATTICDQQWSFVDASGKFHAVPGPGIAIAWGTFAPAGNSLTWSAPETGGNYSVTVKFKRVCNGAACDDGGVGGGAGDNGLETVSWGVLVTPPSLELDHASFGNANIALKTGGGTYASDGTDPVRVPEIQKNAKTGMGSNPPLPLQYNSYSPVCYVWKSKPSISATFNISPNLAAPGIPALIRLTGQENDLELDYGVSTVNLTGSSITVPFTTGSQILQQIDDTNLTLTWEVSFDNGDTFQTIAQTSNELFVTAATPTTTTPTVMRMSKSVNDALDQATPSDAASKLIPAVIPSPFSNNGLQNLVSAWQVLDTNPTTKTQYGGDCITLATLTKYELDMIGVTGSVTHKVYPCSANWKALVDAGPEGGGPFGANLLMWFGQGLGHGWNNFEGCLMYGGNWYEGGIGNEEPSAQQVMYDSSDPNSPADDIAMGSKLYDNPAYPTASRQAWNYEAGQDTAVSYPAGNP